VATNVHHTIETFRGRFPEAPNGGAADDDLVQSVLDETAVRTPIAVWGDLTLEAHGYEAAHQLGMLPYGRDARLKSDDRQTTYGVLREGLETRLGPAVVPRTT
jgi:hypothetical protein